MTAMLSYINKIENKKALPSLSELFYICEHFKITPQEFFDEGNSNPEQIQGILENLKKLDNESLSSLAVVVEKMVGKKK
jgi:transcriptional regulator with XRE-family HTH domain